MLTIKPVMRGCIIARNFRSARFNVKILRNSEKVLFSTSTTTIPLATPTLPNKRQIRDLYQNKFESNPDIVENADEFVKEMLDDMRGRKTRMNLGAEESEQLAEDCFNVLKGIKFELITQRRRHFVKKSAHEFIKYNYFENKESYEGGSWPHEEYSPSSGGISILQINPDVKAKLIVHEESLEGSMSKEELAAFKKIVGPRFHEKNKLVKITCEEYETSEYNRVAVQVRLAQAILKSKELASSSS